MPSPSCERGELEPAVQEIGRRLHRLTPRRRGPRAAAERWLMSAVTRDPTLKAALFRFVDVRPACTSDAELTRHLAELLREADAHRTAQIVRAPRARRAVALAASAGVRQMAGRFIAGADPSAALPVIKGLWRDGVATSVDLLGEATVTEAEADRYAHRCEEALRTLHRESSRWPARPHLERDSAGTLARVNLSVKVSALTPELRALAPQRGVEGARDRLAGLLRTAHELGAHLHVDMESLDGRDTVMSLILGLLGTPEFAEGPSVGVVLQAYLVESDAHLDDLLDWARAHPRSSPLGIRLVKGAYWDQEVVRATQHGWRVPVFTERRDCDRRYELLTRRLIDEFGLVRPAVASHNLRSLAHAAAYADAAGLAPNDLELQVLRGLGDETQAALIEAGRRVRCYCPIGDLVSGMAYLVRRLLENTSNNSFLTAVAAGADAATLLEAP